MNDGASMKQTVSIPLYDEGSPPRFGERCVCCGAPKEAESLLVFSRNVMKRNRQIELRRMLPVPHCSRCARATKSIFLAGIIPFALGFLMCGIAGFAAGAYGTSVIGLDEYSRPEQSPSIVLGLCAGLAGGFIGGFLFEVAARLLLAPFFGAALLRAPLIAVQMVGNSDYVAGLGGRFDRTGDRLELIFRNADAATEFSAVNGH